MPTPAATAAPIELGPLPTFEAGEDAAITGRIAATHTDGVPLTFTVAISPAHGVLTLTTTLDENTGEPSYQIAAPATPEGDGEDTEAETDSSESETAGDETAENETAGDQAAEVLAADVTPDAAGEPTEEPPAAEGAADEDTSEEPAEESAAEGATDAEEKEPAPGDFIYMPAANFAGEDTFAVDVTDSDGFSATVTVTVTVLPVNDAPEITLASPVTLSVGEEVSLPVVVVDVDSDTVTLTVDALPPGLELLDGLVQGSVSADAAGSAYFSRFTAEDTNGGVVTVAVDWTVLPTEPVEEPPAEVTPTEEPTEEPIEEPQPTSPLPPLSELLPPVISSTAHSIGEVPVFAFAAATPGSGALEGYAWLAPQSFGTCPPSANALAAQPAGLDGRTLFEEARAAEVGGAPMLEYAVDLPAPGDYVVAVCGCAPQLAQADLQDGIDEGDGERLLSTPGNNAGVYVGFNGAPIAADVNGAPLAISGFTDQAGFTWQNRWSDPAAGTSGATTFTATEAGPNQVNLWMADDGLIVYSLRITPLAETDVEPGAAAACGPSLP